MGGGVHLKMGDKDIPLLYTIIIFRFFGCVFRIDNKQDSKI